MVENEFSVINHLVCNSKGEGSSIESVDGSSFALEDSDSVSWLATDESEVLKARWIGIAQIGPVRI